MTEANYSLIQNYEMLSYRNFGVLCWIINHNPPVWILVVFPSHMTNVGPEEGISLWSWPHSLDDIVTDECVFCQPISTHTGLKGGY